MDKMDVLSAGTVLHDCYEIEECIKTIAKYEE